MFVALGCDREIDHHDAVLLHDADQQDDADQRDQAEVVAEHHQDRQRTDTRRGQGGQTGDGVAGAPNSAIAFCTASVAWPSATPWARLKLMVIAGNCPWWLIESGRTGTLVQLAKVEIGTCSPVVGDLI